jgi:hypothetical protein
MRNKQAAVFLIILFIVNCTITGQKLVNSPYSRFNLGSIVPSGSYRSLAMGGSGVAMKDNSSIYYINPASYGSIDTTSFLLDFGADYSICVLSNSVGKYQSDDMNFGHLLIGFPLAKGVGFATGLVPYSNGYYSIQETLNEGDPGYDPLTGSVTSTHKGNGSLTNLFAGIGFNITKNLSVGANLKILFGQLERSNQFEFGDYANTFGQFNSEKLRVRGIHFDYGAQYSAKVKKDYFFTAGLSFNRSQRYKSDFEKISERFTAYTPSVYSPDTLSYTNSSSRDSTRLPGTMKFGLSFGKKDKFVAEVNYIYSKWSEASIHGSSPGYLANTKSWLFGIEYIPEKYSNTSFLRRIEYRIGGHIADNYLVINSAQIKELGASCGFGMRMRNSYSKATVYFDFTRKNGSEAAGLHNENYYTIGVSLNLYDFWFIKKKFE